MVSASAYQRFRAAEGRQREPRRPKVTFEFHRPTAYIPCRCGKCSACKDNARWERIFNEKFADPDYYTPRSVPQGSSLGWLK